MCINSSYIIKVGRESEYGRILLDISNITSNNLQTCPSFHYSRLFSSTAAQSTKLFLSSYSMTLYPADVEVLVTGQYDLSQYLLWLCIVLLYGHIRLILQFLEAPVRCALSHSCTLLGLARDEAWGTTRVLVYQVAGSPGGKPVRGLGSS